MFLFAAGAIAMATAPQSVEITVYNANFALVKEVRAIDLRSGRQEVRVEDVAQYIDPTSVTFRNLTAGVPIVVLEQNYQYDLMSPFTILSKSIGKRVRIIRTLESGQMSIVEGELLSAPGQVVNTGQGSYQAYSGMVVRTNDGRILLDPVGTVEVMEIPEGLISKPTLMWDLQADRAGTANVEVAYLTNNISWSADYVLVLNPDDTRADLNGWVTINNQSGATYTNAKLKLIAGDVRRISPPQAGFGGGRAGMAEMARAAEQFVEQSLFEYHLYTLQRPATVRQRETKQIALLSASNVAVKKDLVMEATRNIWRGSGVNYRPGEGWATDTKVKINVIVEVHNSEQNGMGSPLPKGKIRVYKRDADGQVQMLGEDQIDHTPREEKVRLWIGDSFDIVGEHRRVNFRRISPRVTEEDFEIKVRNRKREPETVRVVEHGWADWVIVRESMQSRKTDSNTFEYLVTLQPDEEKVITYTIRTSW
ncbi:MAG: DUF4139 domain-containing protein [Fimbriimonadales bacterium]|nr:DUF4139 domain-containing protein [Fimbriimonadales bacterium]